MGRGDSFFLWLISFPFIHAYEILEFIFYVYIYPLWTGKAVAEGWNPYIVKEELHGLWKPSAPVDISYHDFIKKPNEELYELGFERTKQGHLHRIASPQMYYANPDTGRIWGDVAWKYYNKDIDAKQAEYIKEITLDPFDAITYYNKIQFNNIELLSYNIQMKINFLHLYEIDLIELFFTIIFFLLLFLFYFIFYHLRKLYFKLDRAEYILNEHGLSLFEKKDEISGEDMCNAWRESRRISKSFDLGIEIDYCLYEGSLIGFELFLLMSFIHFFILFSNFLYKYIYLFYINNTEFFTYIFFYLFAFLSIYYWFKYKREIKKGIHRWVDIDYPYSRFLSHYYRTLCWLNLYKLVWDMPIFCYVVWYHLVMLWIYFACDSCDRFMGWNQEYRIDIFNRRTNMHMWWPRVLMNQTWQHFYITLIKPWHSRILYLFFYLFLPILAVFLFIVYYQNKLHVYINNKYLFWNSRRYTTDEIKEQWKKDKVYNYVEAENEKNSRERGLIIL